jgi:hypothetical protein
MFTGCAGASSPGFLAFPMVANSLAHINVILSNTGKTSSNTDQCMSIFMRLSLVPVKQKSCNDLITQLRNPDACSYKDLETRYITGGHGPNIV